MPRFKYKARNLDGHAVDAIAEAASEDALERELNRQGLMLISAAPTEKRRSAFWTAVAVGTPSLSASDLIFMTMELGTSYAAGLPILNTLEDMAASTESRTMRTVCTGVADRVRSGSSLADAMAAYPKCFPQLYVELIGAAEKTGKIDAILEDLVHFLEWQKETKGQIVSATIYPITMIGAVIVLTTVLVLFVFPRFLTAFAATGTQLPLPTRILLGIDHGFRENKLEIIPPFIAIPAVYFLIRDIPQVRWRIDLFKLKAPVIGPMLTKVLMSRFAHNLSMMLASGLDFGSSLRLCERLMQNVVLTQLVSDARVGVEQGRPLSDAMSRGNFMPSLVRRMLKLGENTGEMERSLENVSKYYDKEIPKSIKATFAVLEPVILIFMACTVLFMASAVLLPIYSMLNNIGGK